MKKIILNCSYNSGSYNFICEIDDNKVHYEVKHYRAIGNDNRKGDVIGKRFVSFLKKMDKIDFESINHQEYFPRDGVIMDMPLIDFLYEVDNKFYTCRWQIGCGSREIKKIETLISFCDKGFKDLFPIIIY